MNCTVETLNEQPILGIRKPTPQSAIGDAIGSLLPAIMGAAGPHIAGPPLAVWHGGDPSCWDMEVAVPVAAGAQANDEVTAGVLPGGRAVIGWHVGAYDGLGATWGALNAWIDAQDLVRRGPAWEEYHGDCSATPPDELRTRLVCPVE